MELDDITRWARGDGLEIVLIVTGAALLTRLIGWLADRYVARLERLDEEERAGGLVSSEQIKRNRALAQAFSWAAVGVTYFAAGIVVLEKLNVPLASLVAPATVAGVAIGFGAQRLVQDLLSGFFLFTEHQYGFGDVVRISPPGDTQGVSGAVEELTLRTTKLRTVNGELVVIPNGEIRQVTNLSKDWARAVLDIPLPADADVSLATRLLRDVGEEIASDPAWESMLLDPPSVMGVESIDVGYLQLRFVARTLPGRQWEVGRELRNRIALTLRDAGIVIPASFLATARPSGAA